MGAISIRNVVKRYGSGPKANPVIHGVNAEIADGEFIVIVGPSGCGKSTTLRMIAGLEAPSQGRIVIDGRDVTQSTPADRDIAMVFQNYALYPHMDVAQNMSFALELAGTPRAHIAERVQAAAKVLNISHLLERKPKELSGGQRQRVAMGRAIVREPKVFLFDEPLSNLDAKLRGHMRIEIALLHRRLGKTTVYVTHDQIEAMTLADRIVVMDQGRIQQMGTPDEVFNRPLNQFVAGFIGNPGMNFLDAAVQADGGRLQFAGQAFRCDVPPPMQAAAAGLAGQPVVVGVRPQSLQLEPAPGALTLPLQVDVCEYLGTETVLGCTLRGRDAASLDELGTITLVVPGRHSDRVGTSLQAYAPLERLFAFEPGGHGRSLSL